MKNPSKYFAQAAFVALAGICMLSCQDEAAIQAYEAKRAQSAAQDEAKKKEGQARMLANVGESYTEKPHSTQMLTFEINGLKFKIPQNHIATVWEVKPNHGVIQATQVGAIMYAPDFTGFTPKRIEEREFYYKQFVGWGGRQIENEYYLNGIKISISKLNKKLYDSHKNHFHSRFLLNNEDMYPLRENIKIEIIKDLKCIIYNYPKNGKSYQFSTKHCLGIHKGNFVEIGCYTFGQGMVCQRRHSNAMKKNYKINIMYEYQDVLLEQWKEIESAVNKLIR